MKWTIDQRQPRGEMVTARLVLEGAPTGLVFAKPAEIDDLVGHLNADADALTGEDRDVVRRELGASETESTLEAVQRLRAELKGAHEANIVLRVSSAPVPCPTTECAKMTKAWSDQVDDNHRLAVEVERLTKESAARLDLLNQADARATKAEADRDAWKRDSNMWSRAVVRAGSEARVGSSHAIDIPGKLAYRLKQTHFELVQCQKAEREWRNTVRMATANRDDVWVWQGDGLDDPDSLSSTARVVMEAETLRGFLAAERERDEAKRQADSWENAQRITGAQIQAMADQRDGAMARADRAEAEIDALRAHPAVPAEVSALVRAVAMWWRNPHAIKAVGDALPAAEAALAAPPSPVDEVIGKPDCELGSGKHQPGCRHWSAMTEPRCVVACSSVLNGYPDSLCNQPAGHDASHRDVDGVEWDDEQARDAKGAK